MIVRQVNVVNESNRKRDVIFLFAFFILFPGFFIYHYFVGKSMIPPVLGGYFGIMAVILFPFLTIFYLKIKLRQLFLTRVEILFYLLLLVMFYTALIHFSLDSQKHYSTAIVKQTITALLFLLVCYFIGRYIRLDSKKTKLFLLMVLFSMGIIVITNTTQGMFYLRMSSIYSEYVSTYQGFARSIVVMAIVLICITKSKKVEFILYLFSLVILFLNGARTEFYCFLVSYFVYHFTLKIGNLWKEIKYVFSLFFLVLLIVIFSHHLYNYIPNNRVINLAINPFEQTSFQLRQYQINEGLETIAENPLMGDYGSYALTMGPGNAMHNFLSVWVDLGIIGLLIYIIMFLVIAFQLYKYAKLKLVENTEYRLAVFFFIFCLLAVITGKGYSYMLIGLVVGFYAQFKELVYNGKRS